MPQRKRPPRLTIDEWKELGRACKQMDALASLLHASSWNGKGMALVELASAYLAVARIYNRTEAHIMGTPWPPPTETPQGASGEGGTRESSSGAPIAAPGQEEA
jgi:hypothetical protein